MISTRFGSAPRTRVALWVDAQTARRLFVASSLSVLVRAVIPNTVSLLRYGRPAPTVALPLDQFSHIVSSACSLATVVVAFMAMAIAPPSVARFQRTAALWLGFVLLELLIALHRGPWTLSTSAVSITALLPLVWLDVRRKDAMKTVFNLIASVGVLALIMAVVWPSVAKYGDPSAPWFTRDARLAGPFSTPNEASSMFALGVVLWCARVRESVLSARTPRALMELLIVALPLILTQSYTAWFATGVGIAVVLFAPRAQDGWRPSGLSLLALAAAIYPVRSFLLYLDTRGSATGFNGRQLVWHFAEQGWRSDFLLGHGPGVWRVLIADGALPAWAVNGHSEVLDTLYTTGIVGLVFLAAAVAALAMAAGRQWLRGYSAPFACLAVELVRSYTEVPFQVIYGGLNLFVLLALLALASGRREELGRRQFSSG